MVNRNTGFFIALKLGVNSFRSLYSYIDFLGVFLTLSYTHSKHFATQSTHFDRQDGCNFYNQTMIALPMPLLTCITGILLILIGLWGFLSSWAITALIPLFVGAPLFGCGLMGREGDLRRSFMHAAALLSLMGALGGVFALTAPEKLPNKTDAENDETPFDWPGKVKTVKAATISKTLMTMLCSQHLVLCVASFILARRAMREAQADAVMAEAIRESEKPDSEEQSDGERSKPTDPDDDSAKA